jgi:hypothetical protein
VCHSLVLRTNRVHEDCQQRQNKKHRREGHVRTKATGCVRAGNVGNGGNVRYLSSVWAVMKEVGSRLLVTLDACSQDSTRHTAAAEHVHGRGKNLAS